MLLPRARISQGALFFFNMMNRFDIDTIHISAFSRSLHWLMLNLVFFLCFSAITVVLNDLGVPCSRITQNVRHSFISYVLSLSVPCGTN